MMMIPCRHNEYTMKDFLSCLQQKINALVVCKIESYAELISTTLSLWKKSFGRVANTVVWIGRGSQIVQGLDCQTSKNVAQKMIMIHDL